MSPGAGGAAQASTSVIDVRGLRKAYGDRVVLRDVTVSVQRGEVFCILGPNGAGKTTLVEILEGLRRADGGEALVLGVDPSTRAPALRERVGIVLQECGFPGRYRVRELLDTWRNYYSNPYSLSDLLDLVGLDSEADWLVHKLSGGQRRRLDFALALAGDPDVVFLDEPTTGFDPEARERCWEVISNLRTRGKSIVLTTHYLDEAERLADRVGILADGRFRTIGSPDEVAKEAGGKTHVRFRFRRTRIPRHALQLAPTGIDVAGNMGTIDTADPVSAVRALLNWIDETGIRIGELSVVPPTLNDVYLSYMRQLEERAS